LYEHFTLEGRGGRRYHVVPAIPLTHATLLAGMGPIRPIFAASNFEVAPRYHDIYPSFDAWPSPLPRARGGDDDVAVRWAGRAPDREICRMGAARGLFWRQTARSRATCTSKTPPAPRRP
jgi:hypothetical protein